MQVYYLHSEEPSCFGRVFGSLVIEDDRKILIQLEDTLDWLILMKGDPGMPYVLRLRDVNGELCEIRRKFRRDQLIRIYYFVDRAQNRIVLLNTIIKPDGATQAGRYSGKSKKCIDRDIIKSIELAQKLKRNYYINST